MLISVGAMMRQVLQKRTGDELQQLLEAFQSVTGVTGDPNDPELDKVFQVEYFIFDC